MYILGIIYLEAPYFYVSHALEVRQERHGHAKAAR